MRCCSMSGTPSSTLSSRYWSVHSYAACAIPRADAPTSGRVISNVASAPDARPVDWPLRASDSARAPPGGGRRPAPAARPLFFFFLLPPPAGEVPPGEAAVLEHDL